MFSLLAQAAQDDVHVGGFTFDSVVMLYVIFGIIAIVGIWYTMLRKRPEATDGQTPTSTEPPH
jgi:hypothetical protein